MLNPESSKLNLEKQLREIEAFMQTDAYSSMQFSIKEDLAGIEQSIISTIPDTEANRSHVILLHGQRNELLQTLSQFEDAKSRLRHKLNEIIDAEVNLKDDNNENEN